MTASKRMRTSAGCGVAAPPSWWSTTRPRTSRPPRSGTSGSGASARVEPPPLRESCDATHRHSVAPGFSMKTHRPGPSPLIRYPDDRLRTKSVPGAGSTWQVPGPMRLDNPAGARPGALRAHSPGFCAAFGRARCSRFPIPTSRPGAPGRSDHVRRQAPQAGRSNRCDQVDRRNQAGARPPSEITGPLLVSRTGEIPDPSPPCSTPRMAEVPSTTAGSIARLPGHESRPVGERRPPRSSGHRQFLMHRRETGMDLPPRSLWVMRLLPKSKVQFQAVSAESSEDVRKYPC